MFENNQWVSLNSIQNSPEKEYSFIPEEINLEEEIEKNTKEIRKKSFDFIDFSSPEKLEMAIQEGDFSYTEISAIIEQAIEKHQYTPIDLKVLFDHTSNSFVHLAVIENLPNFAGTPLSQESQEFLKDIIINYFDDKVEMENYYRFQETIRDSIPYYEAYHCDSEEAYEPYDIFTTAAIANLARFKEEGEESLFSAMIDRRENSRTSRAEEREEELKKYKEEYGTEPEEEEDGFDFVAYALKDEEGDLYSHDGKEDDFGGYDFNAKIFNILSEIGSRTSIDMATAFIRDDAGSTYVYKSELSNLFDSIDKNYSAKKLLELLQDDDLGVRQRAQKCLLRLEFGQIGISEEGVKYLEKMYDLGEMNNPDFFVQRLTARGDIGIFDNERVLQKYFNLGDLSAEEKTVKPEIHEFVYETLFREKEGETAEERAERERYLQEFKENYFGFYDDKFFTNTGIRFNNLDFQEQGWFLIYYKHVDEETKNKLIDFARQFGESGLKSFLALEYNDSNGDKILGINDKIDKAKTSEILYQYVRIQSSAHALEEMMQNSDFLQNKGMAEEIQNKMRGNIYDAVMSRATDILSTAYQIARTGDAKAEFYNGQEIKVADIDEVIEAIKVYEDFLEKIKGFFTSKGRYEFNYNNTKEHGELAIHNFTVQDKSDGKKRFASITLRGKGTNHHLEDLEYDGEARINFLFSDEKIASNIKEKSRREATTFRLDRECLVFNETGKNVVSKDNTRKDGKVSLDLGSIYEDSGRENNVLGRVISVGNFHNAQEKKKKPEYYHNKESFYHELGQADVFESIVAAVDSFIKSKYIKNSAKLLRQAA